jgi:hypothetical protein
MTKKLYEVKIELVAYVMAENEKEARDVGEDAIEDQDYNGGDFDLMEVKEQIAPGAGWEHDGLIYGTDKDTTLEEAMKDLPVPEWVKRCRAAEARMKLEPNTVPSKKNRTDAA